MLRIGDGDVYGAEVNAASKLGEDIAKDVAGVGSGKKGQVRRASDDDAGGGSGGQGGQSKDQKAAAFRLPPAALMAPPPLARPRDPASARLSCGRNGWMRITSDMAGNRLPEIDGFRLRASGFWPAGADGNP